MNVIWKPQPKQIEFMQRSEYECLYGGAAGGGKSDALVMEALRQVEIPNYRGIIFRRTYPQLEALISRSTEIYPRLFPKAKYNYSERRWSFPSGAKIFFGHMNHEQDKYNYQGKPYDFVGFDELTHFTYTQYTYLMSRNRPNGSDTRVYMRATANPGGVGHAWVKQRFITPAPPLTPIVKKYEIITPEHKKIEISKRRIFVPATVFDNKILLANDPDYLATLASLPQDERDALLYGNWNSFSGQVFSEWSNDPAHYHDHRFTHVIAPFQVPPNWRIVRCFDFGYTRPFACLWVAFDEEQRAYIVDEFYGCKGEPNVGIEMDPYKIAANIKKIENENPDLRGRNIMGIADPAIWNNQLGESIASIMAKHPFYVNFSKGNNNRLNGLMQFHYRMHFDDKGYCMFYVFDKCKHTIRTLPALVYSQTRTEDIDTDGEDHIYDALRYCLMEYVVAPRRAIEMPDLRNDPIDMHRDAYKSGLYTGMTNFNIY